MSGIVLIVEDDTPIREMAAMMLAGAGFNVMEAEDAEEAIGILEDRAAHVELVFTDIEMPGRMNGLDLAHLISRRWPRIVLLVTSGRAALSAEEMPARGRFLSKPYRLSHVVSQVRQLIAG